MNARRFLAILFAALVVAAVASGQAAPVAKPVPTAAVTLEVDYADEREEKVQCLTGSVKLETDYGTLDLVLDKVKIINFKVENDTLLASVDLMDGNHLNGKMLTEKLTLEAPAPPLDLRTVREVKVIREKNLSLLALGFGLVTLTVMEIVLGVDNIIFLAIVAGRLPPEQQRKARRIGLVAALGTRLLLLFSLSFILGLTKPVITLPIPGIAPDAAELSWRDIILLVGGGFLIVKSVREMHHKMEESRNEDVKKVRKPAGFAKTIFLIAVIDLVFSLDSVITAVGMVDSLEVMVTAMVLAMGVMLFFAEPVSHFVDKHPTVKVLALSFLILIGVLLVAEGLGQHIEKGYVYFAMAFAVVIEFINMSLRPKMLYESISDG